jgi:hypothetical protein
LPITPAASASNYGADQICYGDNEDVAGLHRGNDKGAKMTKRSTWLAILSTLLLAFSAGQAQTTVDVAKITCGQFIGLKVADPDTIAIWLSGYYHGLQHNTIVNAQQLKDQPQNMTSYCLYNGKGGTIPIMEVAEKLLTSDK